MGVMLFVLKSAKKVSMLNKKKNPELPFKPVEKILSQKSFFDVKVNIFLNQFIKNSIIVLNVLMG